MGAITNDPIPIPPPTILRELRTAKMAPLGSVQSGINKQRRAGRVFASTLGLQDDEHDLTFHGGPDKAVHQYCAEHYPLWAELYPSQEQVVRFVPGGFGENLVADGLSERNVCIGDLMRVGPVGSTQTGGEQGALLQVSLPRQPCFKLNQRFGIKNFAPQTYKLARTGWYYRVVEEGFIEEGHELKVVERPHPQWSIERLQHYVHIEKDNQEVVEELKDMPEMGQECRKVFQERWAGKREKETKGRKAPEVWTPFKLVEKRKETPRITAFVWEAVNRVDGAEDVDAGCHITIKLPNGLRRPYSVVGGKTDRFELGIAREEKSRGGSDYLLDDIRIGDTLSFSSITESLPIGGMGSHHILVAGGIGITAFPAMIERFDQIGFAWQLHYAVRSADEVAFASRLHGKKGLVRTYDKSKGERLDIERVLKARPWNSHVYVCGPQRMNEAVISTAVACGMTEDEIHHETFAVDATGDPFTAEVRSKGVSKVLEVGGEQTLLDVMKAAGFETGSSCEVGSCGTCRIGLKEGRVSHRGSALSEEEKKSEMLCCVSRGVGRIVVELEED